MSWSSAHRVLSRVVLALALASLCAPAFAVEITSPGQRFDVIFGGGAARDAGLSGRARFEVVEMSADRVVLDVTLTNTSDSVLFPGARISEFGFESGASLASGSLGVDESRRTRARVRAERSARRACRTEAGALCRFGGKRGLAIGESRTMQLTLLFDPSLGKPDLDRFDIRYGRSRSLGRGVVERGPTGGVPSTSPIPEPHSVALFAIGAAAVMLAARKRVLTAR